MLLNLKIFIDILQFSKGPQDLPTSSSLLNFIILANMAVGLISLDPNIDYTMNIFFALIYIIVTILFIKGALTIRDNNTKTNKYSVRYLQVCSGTLGIHALITLMTGIIIFLLSPTGNLMLSLFFVISIYAWFVNGHIFKNAFDTTMMFGLSISILHSMLFLLVIVILIQILI